MTEEIKETVKSKVLQLIAGNQHETNKFEVKRQWHNLKEDQGKFEFLKDVVAIVNSYGGEDAFIVFGIDEKKIDEIFPSKIQDSGCSDTSQIKDIIDANIDVPIRFDVDSIEIEGKQLSVVHLFPSTQKPHYILKFKNPSGQEFRNVAFTRSGTQKVIASRSDIERMYVERNNIIVERRLEMSLNLVHLNVRHHENIGYYFEHPITIENTGGRVVAITQIELELLYGEKGKNYNNIHFYTTSFSHQNLVIESGKLYNGQVRFKTLFNDPEYYSQVILGSQGVNSKVDNCRIRLSNNEFIFPQMHIHRTAGDLPLSVKNLLQGP